MRKTICRACGRPFVVPNDKGAMPKDCGDECRQWSRELLLTKKREAAESRAAHLTAILAAKRRGQ